MRKILLMIFAATLMFASCSKESLTAESLVGTKWVSDEVGDAAVASTVTLDFSSESVATFTLHAQSLVSNDEMTQIKEASYTLDYPKITFSDPDFSSGRFVDLETLRVEELLFHKQ